MRDGIGEFMSDVDLHGCQASGDLDAPLALTKRHHRDQQEAEEWKRARDNQPPQLTWEEYEAGKPCPGCGRPYDHDPDLPAGSMYWSHEQRERMEAEAAHYRAAHGDCHAYRHSTGGYVDHCGKCCPPPPMSPASRAEIGPKLRAIVNSPTAPHELMRWQLRLYCGHVIERTAHRSHKTYASAGSRSMRCAECGMDPALVIDSRPVGLAGEPPVSASRAVQPAKPRPTTKAQLEARVRELEAEIAALKRSFDGK